MESFHQHKPDEIMGVVSSDAASLQESFFVPFFFFFLISAWHSGVHFCAVFFRLLCRRGGVCGFVRHPNERNRKPNQKNNNGMTTETGAPHFSKCTVLSNTLEISAFMTVKQGLSKALVWSWSLLFDGHSCRKEAWARLRSLTKLLDQRYNELPA